MDFEFHPDQWISIAQNNPILVVLIAGVLVGTCFTQLIKSTYLAFGIFKVSEKRYDASVRWLAVLSTFVATNWLWMLIIVSHSSGLHYVVSLFSGICSPFAYQAVKAAIAWKFPDLAKRLGYDSKAPRGPVQSDPT